jgi:enediyne biosynthesis protein E4
MNQSGSRSLPTLVLLVLLASAFSPALGGAVQSSGTDPLGVEFTDVSNVTGLSNISSGPLSNWASYGPGTSWGDYDGDGDLDLYITARFDQLGMETEESFAEGTEQSVIDAAIEENRSGQTFLMRNDDGQFVDVSVSAGVKLVNSTAIGASWADFDGDGDVDLYISNFGAADFSSTAINSGGEENIMFSNNGNGTFSDVTALTNLGNPGHSTGGVWADYDHDGDLDLYSINSGIVDERDFEMWPETNILYRNDGDSNDDGVPEFSDQTIEAGRISGQELNPTEDFIPAVSNESQDDAPDGAQGGNVVLGNGNVLSPAGTGVTWAALWFDYNKDGWEDLFVASDFGISPLYENNGDGTFDLVTEKAGLLLQGTGMGAHAADIDGDGDFDLCQTNFGPNFIWYNQNGESFERELDSDFHNNDDKRITVNWDCHFFDYDLDGDFDLFTTAGRINTYVPTQENTLFRNDGNGWLTDITLEAGLGGHEKSMGASTVDFDGDGDIDIIIANSDGPLQLFENNAAQITGNHWLKIALQGNQSNSYGIGMLVEVELSNGIVISQQTYAGSGYLGSGDPVVHFGLGSETQVKEVRVQWSSGHIQVIQNVAIDQTLVVMEESPPPVDDNYLVLAAIAILVIGIGGGILLIRNRNDSALSEVDSNLSED